MSTIVLDETQFTPLRLIRTITKKTIEEFAKLFNVSTTYIKSIESGDKMMSKERLQYGLNKLGISYEDYMSLAKYESRVLKSDLADNLKYAFLVARTMSIVDSKNQIQPNYNVERNIRNR
jgi:transcriptional regulator with XRE-family HTH domain